MDLEEILVVEDDLDTLDYVRMTTEGFFRKIQ